ncbi:MAG: BamA/TamA family outer membrane protein [Propionivibrio sp.]|uniref:autotransporter assembly complex protein TamA n=1 Tax=Propionivibrio sp. TaxID=2212460 RepID=UPI001A3D9C90|nr:BamA/TamA family outer membrane protein [Propionivibrio sp.]MBL8412847.1 BamA/TamA family outer membrane protein [Propionivibrio sp.]
MQAALQNTPFFSSAGVELERSAATENQGVEEEMVVLEAEGVLEKTQEEALQVPVIIRLHERAPYNIALGAGYSSNTGARVEGNFRNADFLGRAWELDTGARIEQLRQSVYADIFFPPDGQRHRDSVGAVAQHSDIQGLEIQRVALAASRVQLRGSIEQRLGINWQYERQTPNGQPTSTNQALTATVGWTWRHADDLLDASEGIVAHLQLAGATKALLSDQNFVRTYFRYSQGIPLGKSDALLLRGELGATAAKSSQGIPQDYLFRAGGTNSVRGYAYQSLGIQEGSATLGAQYLITVSAEYTHWFDARWGMALFADAGQAADTRDVFKLAPGYGVGARYKSPVGPLAIDVAWGQLDHTFRMSFSLAVPF